MISGIFLWVEGNISVGDIVDVNGLSGEVEAIALRTTSIRTFSGNLIIVPNGDIRTVTNMTRTFKRAVVDVRLPYDVELNRLLSILEDEMQKPANLSKACRKRPRWWAYWHLRRIASSCAWPRSAR